MRWPLNRDERALIKDSTHTSARAQLTRSLTLLRLDPSCPPQMSTTVDTLKRSPLDTVTNSPRKKPAAANRPDALAQRLKQQMLQSHTQMQMLTQPEQMQMQSEQMQREYDHAAQAKAAVTAKAAEAATAKAVEAADAARAEAAAASARAEAAEAAARAKVSEASARATEAAVAAEAMRAHLDEARRRGFDEALEVGARLQVFVWRPDEPSSSTYRAGAVAASSTPGICKVEFDGGGADTFDLRPVRAQTNQSANGSGRYVLIFLAHRTLITRAPNPHASPVSQTYRRGPRRFGVVRRWNPRARTTSSAQTPSPWRANSHERPTWTPSANFA